MSKLQQEMAKIMLSISMASGMTESRYTPNFDPFPKSNPWKEKKAEESKPKTKVIYYYDENGNLRRKKIKL